MLSIAMLTVVACGGGGSQETPDIEATVEARVQAELAIEATVQSRVKEQVAKVASSPTLSSSTFTPKPTPIPKSSSTAPISPTTIPNPNPNPNPNPVPILPSSSSLLKKSKDVMASLDSFHYASQMHVKAGDFELPMNYMGRFQTPDSLYETMSVNMFGLSITGDFVKVGELYFEKEFMGEWSPTYEFNGLDPRGFWLEEDNLMDLPIASHPTRIEEQGRELYKISWNLSDMEEGLPSSIYSILDIEGDDVPGEMLVEFWIDTEASYLRKFTASIEGDANIMDLSEFTGESDIVTITMEIQFSDFNEYVEPIVAPLLPEPTPNAASSTGIVPLPTLSTGVNIPDAYLAAKVREALGKSSGDSITAEDMATLTTLHAGASGISDLTGLEHAVNMTDLRIWSNQITDLSALAYMPKLETLYSYGNSVDSISPLANLTELSFFNSGRIGDGDISPLSNLTKLETLWLVNSNISDISPLSNLVNLAYLQLGSNGLTDISALSTLTNLWFLNITDNKIVDYSPLDSLINLTDLQSDQTVVPK